MTKWSLEIAMKISPSSMQQVAKTSVPRSYRQKIKLVFGRRRKKSLFRWIWRAALCACIILAFIVGADLPFWLNRYNQATDDAYLRADITPIASHVEGYLVAVPVNDNQRVHAGEVLARVQDTDYRARLAEAEANVEHAEAAVRQAINQTEFEKTAVDAAAATIASTQADLDFALSNQTRYHYLVATGPGTHQEMEQADATAKRLTATLAQDRAQWKAAQQQVEIGKTQIDLAKADLEANRAIVANRKLELQWTSVTAPVDGTVGERLVREGVYVRPGTEIIDLVPLPNVWVVANFREVQLTGMRPGQRANITVDTLPGITFSGAVDSLQPASGAESALLPPDNATGNFTKVVQRFPVKIILDHNQPRLDSLRPGMSVVATVHLSQDPDSHFPATGFFPAVYDWLLGKQ
jgi:membrane fusion protein, multidrug efflux system